MSREKEAALKWKKAMDLIENGLKRLEDIALIAWAGSIGAREEANDIDIFVIISEGSDFVEKLGHFTDEMRRIQRRSWKEGLVISVFPTFKFKAFDEELLDLAEDRDYIQIHLLVYPNVSCLRRWEPSRIVEGLCLTSKVISGDSAITRDLQRDIARSGTIDQVTSQADEQVSYLFSIAVENFVYARTGSIHTEVLRKDVYQKTKYIVRYLTYERLIEKGVEPRGITSWKSILRHQDNVRSKLKKLLLEMHDYQKRKEIPPMTYLIESNIALLRIFEDMTRVAG